VAAAFALGVIGQGVMARGGSWRPSFGNFSFFELRDAPRPAGEELAFYRELGRERPSGVLLEAPWHHLLFTRMLAAHQRVHGQEILVSYLRGFPVNDARLQLRTAVRPEPAAFLRSRARYLVLHLDPGREERSFDPQGGLPFASGNEENIERSLAQHAAWAEAVCRHLTAQWGAPTYRDESLCVFDLDEARATAALAPLPDP
jgi:hypothetical protein